MARTRRKPAKLPEQEGPQTPPSDERPIVVLFADIVGCSEISNHMSLKDYNKFLAEFHDTFRAVAEEYRNLYYKENERKYFNDKIRGDEGCLMILVPRKEGKENYANDLDVAVNFALDLKRRWLLRCKENKERIQSHGLLPTDLAIGIQLGKTYINEEQGSQYRPEGYAINLAKRIEGESRDGKFTRIYVSEGARNELHQLTDEATYTFAPPCSIQPRGISRDIRVFEVKHHFLPTDWNDEIPASSRRTKAASYDPNENEVRLVWQALQASPTNLWLAEEYIMLKLQVEYKKLKAQEKEEDKKELATAYKQAEQVSRRLSVGDQRDAGILTITGFIAGECKNYAEEQKLYDEALELDRQYPEAYWYKGYSMSFELSQQLEDDSSADCRWFDLDSAKQKRVKEILACYEKAVELNPSQAWMTYDLGCELSRWSDKTADMRIGAVRMLKLAAFLNHSVLEHMRHEPYVKPILDDPAIQKLLQQS